MKRHILLIVCCGLLYLVASGALHVTYGDSFGWLSGLDRWEPDNNGGWRSFGSPVSSMPTSESVTIPLWQHYLPIFLPAGLLFLFLFTPFRKFLDPPIKSDEEVVGGFKDVLEDEEESEE